MENKCELLIMRGSVFTALRITSEPAEINYEYKISQLYSQEVRISLRCDHTYFLSTNNGKAPNSLTTTY